jgi:hypothetical protein
MYNIGRLGTKFYTNEAYEENENENQFGNRHLIHRIM